jgi:hypothetical protein
VGVRDRGAGRAAGARRAPRAAGVGAGRADRRRTPGRPTTSSPHQWGRDATTAPMLGAAVASTGTRRATGAGGCRRGGRRRRARCSRSGRGSGGGLLPSNSCGVRLRRPSPDRTAS